MSCQGKGLPETIRLRTYQYPPPTTMPPSQVAAARQQSPLPAIAITPTVSARTGGTTVSFVPRASPAASPATIRAPRDNMAGGRVVGRGSGAGGAGAGRETACRTSLRSGRHPSDAYHGCPVPVPVCGGAPGWAGVAGSGGERIASAADPRSDPGQRLFTRSATAERKSAIATTSLFALPGWRETSRFAAITEATAASPVAP